VSQLINFLDEVDSFSTSISKALGQRSAAPITVTFKGGQKVALDLTDARQRGWSKILESEHQHRRPVYVELDTSTSAIQALLFPIASTVRNLRDLGAPAGLDVELTYSSAVHRLRTSHPRFQEFSDMLRDALARGQTLFVTDTLNTHEIVDVRISARPVGVPKIALKAAKDVGLEGLAPVTPARAQQLFDLVNTGTCAPADPEPSCIPFMFPDDGCWARAHEMCRLMASAGEESKKVWIEGGPASYLRVDTSNHQDCQVTWGWHVAPVLNVSIDGALETWVVDPALFTTPVPLAVWVYAQHDPTAVTTFTERSVFMYWTGETDPDYTETQNVMSSYRNQLLARALGTGGPPYTVCYKEDLFLRDNLGDEGLEPLARGLISCSPDINHFREELADPQGTLGSPAAKMRDDMFERAEFGQPNYAYVRLQNRGAAAADATIDVYYSLASTLPTPATWQLIGSIATASPIEPGEFRVEGPLVWDTVPEAGHYCFIAVVNTPRDPKPNLSEVHTVEDFYNLIRRRNNVTWKNFDVENFFADTTVKFQFVIRGWPRIPYRSDIELDTSRLPADAKVELRLLKRLTVEATIDQLEQLRTTTDHVVYETTPAALASVRNMPLRASDQSPAIVTITTAPSTPTGAYEFSLRQLIDGKEVGRVTQRLNIGEYPYMGNRASLELHVANCDWARQIGRRNKVAFENTERAVTQGYNGCVYCLKELNTDR